MPRVVPSTLLAALMMCGAFVAPASSNDTLASGSSCPCTSGEGGTFNGGGTGTPAVDPSNPNAVYVGGSTRYATPSTAGEWEKTQELRSGK